MFEISRHIVVSVVSVAAASAILGCGDDSEVAPPVEDGRTDGAERLTFPMGGESNQNPCYSPDGAVLVFTRFDNGYNRGPAHIFMLDLDDIEAGPRQLTIGDNDDVNVPFGCFDQETGRVVFASDRDDANDFWTVNADPDNPDLQRITDHGEFPVWIEPVFSPEGDQVAFELDAVDSGDEEALRAQIAVVDLDSGDVEILSNADDSQDDRLPSWSPDGERILFQHRDPSLDESLDRWEAHILSVDNGTVTNLSAMIDRDAASSGPDTDLSWTWNGRFILSSANHEGIEHPSIFMLPVEGGEMIRATTDPNREDGAPCGSPDNEWIAFESHREADEDSPSDIWEVAMPAAAR